MLSSPGYRKIYLILKKSLKVMRYCIFRKWTKSFECWKNYEVEAILFLLLPPSDTELQPRRVPEIQGIQRVSHLLINKPGYLPSTCLILLFHSPAAGWNFDHRKLRPSPFLSIVAIFHDITCVHTPNLCK